MLCAGCYAANAAAACAAKCGASKQLPAQGGCKWHVSATIHARACDGYEPESSLQENVQMNTTCAELALTQPTAMSGCTFLLVDLEPCHCSCRSSDYLRHDGTSKCGHRYGAWTHDGTAEQRRDDATQHGFSALHSAATHVLSIPCALVCSTCHS